jgi:hypothetical protein
MPRHITDDFLLEIGRIAVLQLPGTGPAVVGLASATQEQSTESRERPKRRFVTRCRTNTTYAAVLTFTATPALAQRPTR